MPDFGLTLEGFVAKDVDTLRTDLVTKARTTIDPDLVLDSDDPLGETIGAVAEQLGDAWAALGAVYASLDPDSNGDEAQDVIAAITGTFREPAKKSLVPATVNVNPGTYAAGSLIARSSTDVTARFVNRDAVTNVGGSAADVSAVFEAETAGPVRCDAGDLTVKVSSVSGWNSVTNPSDAVIGRLVETNDELRVRRDEELAASGGSTLDAMRVDLLQLAGVVAVVPLENEDDVEDADGVPAKSFELIVFDGSLDGSIVGDDAIARVIWDSKPAGMRAFGSSLGAATDSLGNARVVRFSRPTIANAYLAVHLTVSEILGWVPGTSEGLVKEAIVAWGDANIGIGAPLILRRLDVEIFKIAGVVDVTAVYAGFSPSPVASANLTAGVRDLIDLDTSRITVTGV